MLSKKGAYLSTTLWRCIYWGGGIALWCEVKIVTFNSLPFLFPPLVFSAESILYK
jgi:hypothetical protein